MERRFLAAGGGVELVEGGDVLIYVFNAQAGNQPPLGAEVQLHHAVVTEDVAHAAVGVGDAGCLVQLEAPRADVLFGKQLVRRQRQVDAPAAAQVETEASRAEIATPARIVGAELQRPAERTAVEGNEHVHAGIEDGLFEIVEHAEGALAVVEETEISPFVDLQAFA